MINARRGTLNCPLLRSNGVAELLRVGFCMSPRQGAHMGIAVLFLVLALGVAAPASADPVTISGSGNLDYGCCFAPIGDPFGFSLSFQTVSADQDVDPTLGYYSLGAGMFSVRLGSYTFSAPSSKASGTVWYDVASGTAAVAIFADSLTPPSVTPPYAYPVPVALSLRAWGIDNVSNDSWPTDLVAALNAAPLRYFRFWPLCDICEDDLASGRVDFFTEGPAPVPEPATLLLLGTGVVGVAGARRWRQRKT